MIRRAKQGETILVWLFVAAAVLIAFDLRHALVSGVDLAGVARPLSVATIACQCTLIALWAALGCGAGSLRFAVLILVSAYWMAVLDASPLSSRIVPLVWPAAVAAGSWIAAMLLRSCGLVMTFETQAAGADAAIGAAAACAHSENGDSNSWTQFSLASLIAWLILFCVVMNGAARAMRSPGPSLFASGTDYGVIASGDDRFMPGVWQSRPSPPGDTGLQWLVAGMLLGLVGGPLALSMVMSDLALRRLALQGAAGLLTAIAVAQTLAGKNLLRDPVLPGVAIEMALCIGALAVLRIAGLRVQRPAQKHQPIHSSAKSCSMARSSAC